MIISFLIQFISVTFAGYLFCYALIWNYESSAMNESGPAGRKRWIWKFALAGAIVLGLIWAWSLTGFAFPDLGA